MLIALAVRLIQDVNTQDATTQAAFITAIGVIVVAIVGFFSAKVSSGAKHLAQDSSKEAQQAAYTAKGYVEALKAKDELIGALENRVRILEAEKLLMSKRIEGLERRANEEKHQKK